MEVYDGKLDIAIGKSRKETRWKNTEMSWSDFVKKISTTHRTAEKYVEYMAAKKQRQDEIKDIGGFVGGYISGGRRKSSAILHRQLLTLDIDFCGKGFWEDFTMLYGNAAALYSTHKHSPDNPRLRLIMPIDRPVRPDEYEAIARQVAGVLDIELFDPTTFQAERLMYWPSTSMDGTYQFEHQQGPWLCADEILSSYRDWTDSSEWPVSVKVNTIIHKSMQKQGDPLEKPGVIGAFCRTYSIQEAIEAYLTDVYRYESENRYSYKEGSTAGGLVTYDDKFAFSHHGTDPIQGKLCNSFDLVRIHKFGLTDEDKDSEQNRGNTLPSFTAMVELATKDKRVRALIVAEKLESAKEDFKNAGDYTANTEEEADQEWKEKLDVDRKGNVYSTIDNIVLILENDPYFKGRIAFDEFEKCEVAIKNLSWRKVNAYTRRLNDRDDANIRHYLERAYGISNATKARDAMQVVCEKTSFHPVKDYFKTLTWDGTERLDTLLIDYQGAEDSLYTRSVTRKMLVAAVARIYRPGIKFDNILTLVGKQGLKKSSLISKIGRQWFSDSFSFNMLSRKETAALEQIQGVWILEIAELAGMAKADIETVKHFVTKREDRFRVAYGRRTENFPRQCVFFATTNKFDFLRDKTGNRRYWPVPVWVTVPQKDVFKDLSDYEVDQIWAEAIKYFKAGESLYLSDELTQAAIAMQNEHTEEHPWASIISKYLDTTLPEDWPRMGLYERRSYLDGSYELTPKGNIVRTKVCVPEIWAEAIRGRDVIDARVAGLIREILEGLEGWERVKKLSKYGTYGPQRNGYFRTEKAIAEMVELSKEGVTRGVTRG